MTAFVLPKFGGWGWVPGKVLLLMKNVDETHSYFLNQWTSHIGVVRDCDTRTAGVCSIARKFVSHVNSTDYKVNDGHRIQLLIPGFICYWNET